MAANAEDNPRANEEQMKPYFMRMETATIPRPDNAFTRLFKQGRTDDVGPIFAATITSIGVGITNLYRRYHYFARLPYHFGAAAGMYFAIGWMDYIVTRNLAEKDAMMHHYISLHPEDFEEEPAPKLKYVLYPWYPFREHWDGLKGYPLR